MRIIARGEKVRLRRSVWDAAAERIVSSPDSVKVSMMIHTVYLVGQPRWQAPRVRPIIGDLPDDICVIEMARSDGGGTMKVLFDPDRVTVSGHTADTLTSISGRRLRQARGVETPEISTERPRGRVPLGSMGNVITDTLRTNESQSGIGDVAIHADTGGPKNSRSHAMCDHPSTKEARRSCRKQKGCAV